ncbi:hypothetical protein [Nocardioides sp. L-11A]|uniref:hypothetical protein n=1 Tax=Nocardioides sp. L-11A TaxID=3043848 RepID=UPI00249B2FC5|nr:hypothetical protein QJ852_15285 [Nocardioides sp. L-11A]
MTEERRGEQWHTGMRVRVWNRYEEPGQWRIGTIVDRSWGRDRGAPIYRFTVEMDGVEGDWVFEPGQLHSPTDE